MHQLISHTIYPNAHNLNIYLHIGFGVVAILLAIIQLVTQKGGERHKFIGRLFMRVFSAVIVTAALGAFIFNSRPFLAILTISAAYSCIAGYRVLKLKGNRPLFFDNMLSASGISICSIFAIAVDSSEYIMAPVIVYSALGALSLICIYDLMRMILPLKWLRSAWLAEHIYKMVSCLSALLSAAGGNLFASSGAIGPLLAIVSCLILAALFIFMSQRENSES